MRKIGIQLHQNALKVKQLHAIYITTAAQNPSVWSQLIRHHLSYNFLTEAVYIYTQNLPFRTTQQPILPLILKACTYLSLALLGKSLHSESIKVGTVHDVRIGTTLISMYSKCHCLMDACKLFDEMPFRNAVTYNAMINGYASNGNMVSAMSLFDSSPERTPPMWTTIIEGLARRGDTQAARELFEEMPPEMRTVVTWTAMVHGYTINGEMDAAREIFEQMPVRNVFVWSSMITGYFKMGNASEARAMFDRNSDRNLVVWNALISGYAQIGLCKEAMEAYKQMQVSGFQPDEFTVTSILSVCSQIGLIDIGKEVHELIRQKGIKMNQFVSNGLIDMYAKCGDLDRARRIFERMSWRNDSCWNAMISGFASHGHSEEALKLFSLMEMSEVRPNGISFLVALSACAHGGLVQEGLGIFAKIEKYGLERGVEHYGCLVDLLGRAGMLTEAYDVIVKMPMRADEVVWGAMLGACKVHMDGRMTRRVVNDVNSLNCGDVSSNEAVPMMVANIYAASERWEEAERVRRKMAGDGVMKTPGCSSILIESMEH